MKPFVFVLLFTCAFQMVCAGEVPSAIRLQVQNKPVALPDGVQQQLRQQMIALVESSNFHSGPGGDDRIFTFSGVQQDYRDSISSSGYLLVTLPAPQKIRTVGGEIVVAEIILGLQRPSGKNSLFTIDESGRLVSHAKYAGEIWLRIEQTLAEAQL